MTLLKNIWDYVNRIYSPPKCILLLKSGSRYKSILQFLYGVMVVFSNVWRDYSRQGDTDIRVPYSFTCNSNYADFFLKISDLGENFGNYLRPLS